MLAVCLWPSHITSVSQFLHEDAIKIKYVIICGGFETESAHGKSIYHSYYHHDYFSLTQAPRGS